MEAGHEHAAHNHSAHAAHGGAPTAASDGMDMGGMGDMKYMASVGRRDDGSYFYYHGGFSGHIVPGAFFIFWGTWWAVATFAHYFQARAAKRPFQTRGWQLLPVGPRRLRQLPLEPFIKLVLPFFGILGELWLGHPSYRRLFEADGKFMTDNLNDWQHSTMYAGFMASGAVDLLTHYLGAPRGTELAFLSLSFLSEGLLLVFHLKGPQVEIMVHLILVLQVFATVVAILCEVAAPRSLLMAAVRPWLTILQGVWWLQTAYIMYKSEPQWDPEYMGSGMMVPVPFVLWTLGTAAFVLTLLLAIRAVAERSLGRKLGFEGGAGLDLDHVHEQLPMEEDPELPQRGGYGAELEMSDVPLKTYAAHAGHGA